MLVPDGPNGSAAHAAPSARTTDAQQAGRELIPADGTPPGSAAQDRVVGAVIRVGDVSTASAQ